MSSRFFVLLAAGALLLSAGEKKPATGQGENEDVSISATAYADKDSVKQLLGTDLDGYYVVLDVKIASRFGKEISVERDDFVLRTDKDGERSTPFTASQIAGKGALVISQTSGGGGVMGESGGPMWGGYPLGGSGGGFGNGGDPGGAQARMDKGGKDKDNPLKGLLDKRILPEKKTTTELAGLLYFPLGKQKVKDLELLYKGAAGKVNIRFK